MSRRYASWLAIQVFAWLSLCLATGAWAQTANFTQGLDGTATTTYTIAVDALYVRIVDASANGDPATAETTTVSIFSEYSTTARDTVSGLVLTETGPNTGIFVGPSGGLLSEFGVPDNGDSRLQCSGTRAPDRLPKFRAFVTYPGVVTDGYAYMFRASEPSTTRLVDGASADATSYLLGTDTIHVEVSDPDENSDPLSIDQIALTVPAALGLSTTGGDGEGQTLLLTETNADTGVFHVSLPSGVSAGPISGNGILEGQSGQILTATYTDPDGSDTSSDSANLLQLSASTVKLVNASGTEQTTFPIGTLVVANRIYVEVNDKDQDQNYTVQETLTVDIQELGTLDQESGLVLTETAADSGIFRGPTGGLPSTIGAASLNDGTLQCRHGSSCRASYTDPDDGTDTATDNAFLENVAVVGSIRFTNNVGTDVGNYQIGVDGIYLTVTDADQNFDATVTDSFSVELVDGYTGDRVVVPLSETGTNTGVFRNTTAIVSEVSAVADNTDDVLQSWDAAVATATYTDPNDAGNVATDTATMRFSSTSTVRLTNGTGTEIATYQIGVTPIFVTLVDNDENTSPTTTETVNVTLTVPAIGDTETVILTETGVDTGSFRNTVALSSVVDPAVSGDGVIQTIHGSTLQVAYTDDDDGTDTASDTATLELPLTFSQISFTDAAGTTLTTYTVAVDPIYMTLWDADENRNPNSQETVQVLLDHLVLGDQLFVDLAETGNDTGVFRNLTGIPSEVAPRNLGDTILQVQGNPSLIRCQYTDSTAPSGDVTVAAAFMKLATTTAILEFVNASGTAVTSYNIFSERIYLQITDPDSNQNPNVAEPLPFDPIIVWNTVNEDKVDVTGEFTETGPNTGVWRGPAGGLALALESSPITSTDDILEASNNDTAVATCIDNGSLAFDNALLFYKTVSVITLCDEFGAQRNQFWIGPSDVTSDPIYIQVVDDDANLDPDDIDTVTVQWLRARDGSPFIDSQLSIVLTETSSSSGIFRTTTDDAIESERDLPVVNDYTFQCGDGFQVWAYYRDEDDPSDEAYSNVATMRCKPTNATVYYMDATLGPSGDPADATTSYNVPSDRTAEEVWITVVDDDENLSPIAVDQVQVTYMDPKSGDSETLTLFEGAGLETNVDWFSNPSGIPTTIAYPVTNDGSIQTAHLSTPTAFYWDDDDLADTDQANVTMIYVDNGDFEAYLTDGAGTEVTTYFVDVDGVYVTVIDPDENRNGLIQDTVTCAVDVWAITAGTAYDSETVFLTETTASSGIFRNVTPLPLLREAMPVNENARLEVGDVADQELHVTYDDPAGAGTGTDDADIAIPPTVGVVRFTTVAGTDMTTFPIGANYIFVTVLDEDMNADAAVQESLDVTLYSTYTGDVLASLTLTETTSDSGSFRNTLAVSSEVDLPDSLDGRLQVAHRTQIVVGYDESGSGTAWTSDTAWMEMSQVPSAYVGFLNPGTVAIPEPVPPTNETTEYYLYTEAIHVFLDDLDGNKDPFVQDTVTVYVSDPTGGDVVALLLTETDSNSHQFVSTTGIGSLVGLPNTANTSMETGVDRIIRVDWVDPESGTDTRYATAAMRMDELGSQIAFTDAAGTTVTSYAIDPIAATDRIFITVYDLDEDRNPSVAETLIATLFCDDTGDRLESILLTETGPNTHAFRNITGIDSEIAVANLADSIMQVSDEAMIICTYLDSTDSSDWSTAEAQMKVRPTVGDIAFVDASGTSKTWYYIGSPLDQVYIQLSDADENRDATIIETVTVELYSTVTGDYEGSVALSEIASDSGIFRSVGLSSIVSDAVDDDGIIQTASLATLYTTWTDPEDAGETDTATCSMRLYPTASIIRFIVDATGPLAATETIHTVGLETIYVEVRDDDENERSDVAEQLVVQISSANSTDVELLTLYETDDNSGIFQSSLPPFLSSDHSRLSSPGDHVFTFQVVPGTVKATYQDNDDFGDSVSVTIPTTLDHPSLLSSLEFTDSTGAIKTEYYIGTEGVYVTLEDPSANRDMNALETVSVWITEGTTYTSDTVQLNLQETLVDSGIFRNLLPGIQSIVALAITSDGILQTADGATIVATYVDSAYPADTCSGEADMVISPTTSTIAFTDILGTTRSWYSISLHEIYLQVVDSDENRDPTTSEVIYAHVWDPVRFDTETWIELTEVGTSSGVFRSTSGLPSSAGFVNPDDGILQTYDGAEVYCGYVDADDAGDISSSTARMYISSSNAIIDFTGSVIGSLVATYVIGLDEVFVEVHDLDEDVDGSTLQSVIVTIHVSNPAGVYDSETITLQETDVASGGYFRNDLDPLEIILAPPTSVTTGNNRIEVTSDFVSIWATYKDNDFAMDTAVTSATLRLPNTTATVAFVDGDEVVQEYFLVNRPLLYIQVTDEDRNYDPTTIQTVTVRVDGGSPLFDQDSFTLTEIGPDAGVFRNLTALTPYEATTATTYDSRIHVVTTATGADEIVVTYEDLAHGELVTDSCWIVNQTTATLVYTDADGTPLTTYYIGETPIYLTLNDADQNFNASVRESVVVTITSTSTGDVETRILYETGANSGIFRNTSAQLMSSYGILPSTHDGLLQVDYEVPADATMAGMYSDPTEPAEHVTTSAWCIPKDLNDWDGDGIPNAYEIATPGLNPHNSTDAAQDNDADGRSNFLEYWDGTDPNDPSDNLPTVIVLPLPVLEPQVVELDSSNSTDPSTPSTYPGGQYPPGPTDVGITAQVWSAIAWPGPTPALNNSPTYKPVLSSTTNDIALFVARIAGDYTFTCRAYDEDSASNQTLTTVTIQNVPPRADAGPDITCYAGVGITFDGRGSTDANRDGLTYTWDVVEDPTGPVSISIGTGAQRPWTPTPGIPGRYEIRLTVSDGVNLPQQDYCHVLVNLVSGDHVPSSHPGFDVTTVSGIGNLTVLDGSRSQDVGGAVVTYNWTFVSGPVGLPSVSGPSPIHSFNVPSPGVYLYRLTVTDDTGLLSRPEEVRIFAYTPASRPPVADAGPDVYDDTHYRAASPPASLDLVDLNGSGSNDSDPPGTITTLWEQAVGPSIPLDDDTTATPGFLPIETGIYEWELKVTDLGGLDSAVDRVRATVDDPGSGDHVPTANAGLDRVVASGLYVQLDGSLSQDADGATLGYHWTQLAGPTVTLNDYRIEKPTFLPPQDGVYRFSLRVWDGVHFSHSDTVEIRVGAPPSCDAGPGQGIYLGLPVVPKTVTFSGASASDPNGLPLSIHWSQDSGPLVVLNSPSSLTGCNVVLSQAGVYVFRLRVDNGVLWSEDTITVTATSGDTKPTIVITPGTNVGAQQDTLTVLNASASYDQDDGITPGAGITGWFWQFISGPHSVLITTPYASAITFTPLIGHGSTYRFRVTIYDGEGNVVSQEVVVNVTGSTLPPPTLVTAAGGGGCHAGATAPAPWEMTLQLMLLLAPLGWLFVRRSRLRS